MADPRAGAYPDCGEVDCEDGWILNDCFEDTCCCADPDSEHGFRPCPGCNAEGKR